MRMITYTSDVLILVGVVCLCENCYILQSILGVH